MALTLYVLEGPNKGAVVNLLESSSYTIGSGMMADIILADMNVEDHHMSLSVAEDGAVTCEIFGDFILCYGALQKKGAIFVLNMFEALKVGQTVLVLGDRQRSVDTVRYDFSDLEMEDDEDLEVVDGEKGEIVDSEEKEGEGIEDSERLNSANSYFDVQSMSKNREFFDSVKDDQPRGKKVVLTVMVGLLASIIGFGGYIFFKKGSSHLDKGDAVNFQETRKNVLMILKSMSLEGLVFPRLSVDGTGKSTLIFVGIIKNKEMLDELKRKLQSTALVNATFQLKYFDDYVKEVSDFLGSSSLLTVKASFPQKTIFLEGEFKFEADCDAWLKKFKDFTQHLPHVRLIGSSDAPQGQESVEEVYINYSKILIFDQLLSHFKKIMAEQFQSLTVRLGNHGEINISGVLPLESKQAFMDLIDTWKKKYKGIKISLSNFSYDKTERGGFQITSIIISENDSLVRDIDNKIYHVGDRLPDGRRILKISPHCIRLLNKDNVEEEVAFS